MHVINKEGIRLDEMYSTHERFLEDIDDYINENYVFRVNRDYSIDLLDVVCGHLLHWQYKTYADDTHARLIYNDFFQQNEILNRLIKTGDPTPESVIYEFDGISVYDDLNDRNVLRKDTYENFEINLDAYGILHLTAEEFEDLGGEITLPEDEEDEVEIDLSCSGNVFFFMKESDEEIKQEYMIKCIEELNKIYSSQGMKLIDIEDSSQT